VVDAPQIRPFNETDLDACYAISLARGVPAATLRISIAIRR
jgi:hypothetical protein